MLNCYPHACTWLGLWKLYFRAICFIWVGDFKIIMIFFTGGVSQSLLRMPLGVTSSNTWQLGQVCWILRPGSARGYQDRPTVLKGLPGHTLLWIRVCVGWQVRKRFFECQIIPAMRHYCKMGGWLLILGMSSKERGLLPGLLERRARRPH